MDKLSVTATAVALVMVVCMFLTAPSSATAQSGNGNFGIGLMIGEPTGISFKYWNSDKKALGGGAAWSLGQYDAVHLHADYLWHSYSVFEDVEKGELPLYYGVGGRVVLAENDAVLGIRVPVGLNYRFEDNPLDLFLELAPTVNLLPDTDFDINGALGIRIYL